MDIIGKSNQVIDGAGQLIGNANKNFIVRGNQDIIIQNYVVRLGDLPPVDSNSSTVGFDVRQNVNVRFKNIKFLLGQYFLLYKYGYGFRLSYSNTPTDGNDGVFLEDIELANFGPPSADYSKFNRDGIANEVGNKRVYVKRLKAPGATDTLIDNKSDMWLDDSDLMDSFRISRTWPNVTFRARNSRFSINHPVSQLLWFENQTGKDIFYNCSFKKNGAIILPTSSLEINNGPLKPEQVEIATSDPLAGIWFFQGVAPIPTPVDTYTKQDIDMKLNLLTVNGGLLAERLKSLEAWQVRMNEANQ